MTKPSPLKPGSLIEPYRIVEVLSQSRQGVIYQADRPGSEESVFIEEYLPAGQCRRIRESTRVRVSGGHTEAFEAGISNYLKQARILAQTRSPYVNRVKEYSEANGTAYWVIPYEPGQTLERYLRDNAVFGDQFLWDLMMQLLKGLRLVHASNLLHLNINPISILLRDHGPAMLTGFGYYHHEGVDLVGLADSCWPCEMLAAGGSIGPWSDLYALGSILYRCVVGAEPVHSRIRLNAVRQGLEDPLLPANEARAGDYHFGLLNKIDWMLHIDPKERPQSVDELMGPLAAEREHNLQLADHEKSPESLKIHRQKPTEHQQSVSASVVKTLADSQLDASKNSTLKNSKKRAGFARVAAGLIGLSVAAGAAFWFGRLSVLLPDNIDSFVVDSTQPTAQAALPVAASESPVEANGPETNLQAERFGRPGDNERADEYRAIVKQTAEIDELLEIAQGYLDEQKLVGAGNQNAFAVYQQILRIEEDNYNAAEGIARIGDSLFDQAQSAFNRGKINRADRLLIELDFVNPKHKKAKNLKQKIVEHKRQEAREIVFAEQQQKTLMESLESERSELEEEKKQMQAHQDALAVDRDDLARQVASLEQRRIEHQSMVELFTKAEEAYRRGDLVTPENDNAVHYYQLILKAQQDHPMAQAGIVNVSRFYTNRFRENILLGRLPQAQADLNVVESIEEGSADLPALRLALSRARDLVDASIQSTESAPATVTETGGASETPSAEPRQANPQAGSETVIPSTAEVSSEESGSEESLAQVPTAPLEAVPTVEISQVSETEAIAPSMPDVDIQAAETAPDNLETASQPTVQSSNAASRPIQYSDVVLALREDSIVVNVDRSLELERGIKAYYSRDYETAIRFLLPLANENYARAQFRVGVMFDRGRGVVQDSETAMEWFRKSLPEIQRLANNGVAWAQSDLATLYEEGKILTKNEGEALKWYQRAATQGYSGAQTNLGVMYANGVGVRQNRERALVLLKQAAAQGDKTALANLQVLEGQ